MGIVNKDRMSVFVKTTFEGYHRWKDAPDSVKFLRDFHRHIFHVKLMVEVEGHNREVEFIQLKRNLIKWLNRHYAGLHFEESCEQIAQKILNEFDGILVTVSEDDENGAVVTRSRLSSTKSVFEMSSNIEKAGGNIIQPNPTPLALRKRAKCFIGIEAEGPFRGVTTFFIPGSMTVTELNRVVKNYTATNKLPERFYYGAGMDTKFNYLVLDYLSELGIDEKLTTIDFGDSLTLDNELLYCNYLVGSSYVVVSEILPSKKTFRNLITYRKILTSDRVILIDRDLNYFSTNLNDSLYSMDKEIL